MVFLGTSSSRAVDKEMDAMRRTDIEMTQTVPRSDLRLYTISAIMAA